MNPLLVIGKKNGKNDFIDILKKFNIKYQKINTEDKIRDFIKNREKIDDYFCKNKFQGLIIIAYNYPKLPHKEEIVVIRSILNIFLQMEKPIFSEFFPISGIFTNEVQQNPFWRWIIVNGEKKQKKAKDGHHFSTNLSHLTLLEPHQCFSLQPEKNIKKQIRPHVFYGKVAGVYNAIYGLPKKKEVALGNGKIVFFLTPV